jgi:Concanavalin A-like lectin/glucanases superfamily
MNSLLPLPRDQRKIDADHLNLLAVFHFVGTGLAVLCFVCRKRYLAGKFGGVCLRVLCWLALMVAVNARSAVLTHRYAFDADANDSVGTANGLLQGNAVIAGGALVLDGTNSGVRLPNDLFASDDSVSFEVWYADEAVSSPNGQLYNFSGANGGMTYSLFGQGNCYVGSASNLVSLVVPAVGGTNHLIWTQDGAAQTAQIYINGLLAAQRPGFTNTPAMIGSTTNNWIGAGRSNTPALNFKGNILEFRTYQGALAPLDAAVLDAFGPDQPQLNPGTLLAVRVAVPTPTGPGALFRANVFADFTGITNVNISTQPDLVLLSDNTNVIAVATDQRLNTLAPGTANLTAIWQGFSNTQPVMVAALQDIALLHRYGFNEQTNDWIVHDSVGTAHGKIINPSVTYAAFTGKGELKLTSSGNNTAIGGYVALPCGILSSLSEVTIEAWITWTTKTIWPWQRIFDFGSTSGYPVGNYFFMTTEANTFTSGQDIARVTITTNGLVNETPRLDWTNVLPLNVTSFVAVTYSPVRGVTKFYINGRPVASGVATIPLSAIIDTNNWLGRSQYSGDTYFGGRYNEFRIYSGLLSDSDVAADYVTGPEAVGVDYMIHDYVSSNALTLTWGPSATNLMLQTSPVLGAGVVWVPVTNAPILQNGRWGVTAPLTGAAAYFRLHAP